MKDSEAGHGYEEQATDSHDHNTVQLELKKSHESSCPEWISKNIIYFLMRVTCMSALRNTMTP